MDRIPETNQNNQPDVPLDAESDNAMDIVNNLTDEQLDDAWEVEAKSWYELGLNPGQNISVDQFQLRSKSDIVTQMLIEAGLIDEEKFNDRVKRLMLANMIELRRQHQRQLLQAKLMEGVQMPTPKPGMFLPPGMKNG